MFIDELTPVKKLTGSPADFDEELKMAGLNLSIGGEQQIAINNSYTCSTNVSSRHVAVVGVLITLASLIGGTVCVLVVCTILRVKKMRTRINILLLDLLMADILLIAVQIPLFIFSLFSGSLSSSNTLETFCTAYIFLVYSFVITNITSLALVSLDRYVAIQHPFFYTQYMHRCYFTAVFISPWVLAFTITSPALFKSGWAGYEGRNSVFCGFRWSVADTTYIVSVFLVAFVLPLAIVVVTNVRVHLVTRKHMARAKVSIQGTDLDSSNKVPDVPSLSVESPISFSNGNGSKLSDCKGVPNDVLEHSEIESEDVEGPSNPYIESNSMELSESAHERIERQGKRTSSPVHFHNMATSSANTGGFLDIPMSRLKSTRSHSLSGLLLLSTTSESRKLILSSLKEQFRVLVSTYMLIIAFICCWFPFLLPRILSAYGGCLRTDVALYTSLSPSLVSLFDPLIILVSRTEIRKALKGLTKEAVEKIATKRLHSTR